MLDDDIPEFDEHFQVVMVSAVSGDGKPGTTPTSGASIDPESAVALVTIKASDHPYGMTGIQLPNFINIICEPSVNLSVNLYIYKGI